MILSHVLIVPERGISAEGLRKLRDLRSRTNDAGGWPNPSALRLHEFAARILRVFEQDTQTRLAPSKPFTPLESLAQLLQAQEENVSPLELWLQLKQLSPLQGIGASFEEWRQIIHDFEEGGSSLELKPWTQKILSHLRLEAAGSQARRLTSNWSRFQPAMKALRELSSNDSFWLRVCEQSPQSSTLHIEIQEGCELYPLERKLLSELSAHFEKCGIQHRLSTPQVTRSNDTSRPTFNFSKRTLPTQKDFDTHKTGLFWGFVELDPSPLETLFALPGDIPIDLPKEPEAASQSGIRLYRALCAWIDGSKRASLVKESQLASLLISFEISASDEWTFPQVWKLVRSNNPLRKFELDALEGAIQKSGTERVHEWIEIFFRESLFAFSDGDSEDRPKHKREHPQGLAFLPLRDLIWSPFRENILWTDRHSIEMQSDPMSAHCLGERVFPPKLSRAIEAAGYTVPDASREAQSLACTLISRPDEIFYLERDLSRSSHEILNEQNDSDLAKIVPNVDKNLQDFPLSPSALESYLDCPFQFFARHVLKCRPVEEWDPLDLSPLANGRWIHRALEVFFKENPSFSSMKRDLIESQIFELLVRSLDESFGEHSTPSYLKILNGHAASVATELARYLDAFEAELSLRLPSRKFATEFRLKGQWKTHPFSAVLDRIDILSPSEVFIWDYKTGSAPTGQAGVQVKRGDLQWFVYKKELENLPLERRQELGITVNARIVGGGYLTPLRLEKSQIFIYDTTSQAASQLADLCKQLSMKISDVSPSEQMILDTNLDQHVETVVSGIDQRIFWARPKRPVQDCPRCNARALCGRPDLVLKQPGVETL